MRYVLFFAVLLWGTACGWHGRWYRQALRDNIRKNLIYVRDYQTGLCYAVYSAQDMLSITNVPCRSVRNQLER